MWAIAHNCPIITHIPPQRQVAQTAVLDAKQICDHQPAVVLPCLNRVWHLCLVLCGYLLYDYVLSLLLSVLFYPIPALLSPCHFVGFGSLLPLCCTATLCTWLPYILFCHTLHVTLRHFSTFDTPLAIVMSLFCAHSCMPISEVLCAAYPFTLLPCLVLHWLGAVFTALCMIVWMSVLPTVWVQIFVLI